MRPFAPLDASVSAQTSQDDWVTRRMKATPFNPYGPAMGGQEFSDKIFAMPPSPAARELSFDRNAYYPHELDSNGQLYPLEDPRQRLIRALIK